jgi:hypothetical protein
MKLRAKISTTDIAYQLCALRGVGCSITNVKTIEDGKPAGMEYRTEIQS